jgi:hypothetical protein
MAIGAARLPLKRIPWRLATAALLVAFVLLLWFNAAPLGNIHTGDTDNLVLGARAASECVHLGQWTGCGHTPGQRWTAVFPYPLLQYLPATVLVHFKWSNSAITGALARINIIAFAACLVLLAMAARRFGRRGLLGPLLAVGLASSAVYQATAGFGEMLAATVILAATVAVLYRRPVLTVLLMALAVTSKETLAPFLLLLALLGGRDETDRWLPPKRVLIPVCVGLVLGQFATIAFNIFRFGTWQNVFYLDPQFRTPGLRRQAEFLLGLWTSPTSGLAVFWPVATIVFVGAAVVAVRRLVTRPKDLRSWLPTTLAVAIPVAFTAGLALWFAPFGWIAYGPRLAVPIAPSGAVIALWTMRTEHQPILRRLLGGRPVAAVVLTLGVIVAGWPQFGAAWSSWSAVSRLIRADNRCPNLTEISLQQNARVHYDCTSHAMWRTDSLPVAKAATAGGGWAIAARIIAALACATAFAHSRRELRAASDPRRDPVPTE